MVHFQLFSIVGLVSGAKMHYNELNNSEYETYSYTLRNVSHLMNKKSCVSVNSLFLRFETPNPIPDTNNENAHTTATHTTLNKQKYNKLCEQRISE